MFQVDQATRDGTKNCFKGTRIQLSYARGELRGGAERSDYKTNKKEVNIATTFVTKIQRQLLSNQNWPLYSVLVYIDFYGTPV